MPFTPFHMGPGLAVKALLRGSFSLMVFGWAQIVMDIQPLVVIFTETGRLHGFSHTYLGASLLAAFSALSGKYVGEIGLFMMGGNARGAFIIPWKVAFLSAFIGTFSHVLLDSIMHLDLRPFYPVTAVNPMLGVISNASLHGLCVLSGLVGAMVFFGVNRHQQKKRLSR